MAAFSTNATNDGCSDTVQFTDNSVFNPTSWLWILQGAIPSTSTLQNPQVVYPNQGNFTAMLIASNANGSDTAYQAITNNNCPTTGIGQVTISDGAAIFPNPNDGNFILSVTVGAENKSIKIYNNIGQVVYEHAHIAGNAGAITLSLPNLSNGVYLIAIGGETVSELHKLVISR